DFASIAVRHRVLTRAVFARDPGRGLEALKHHADLTVASTEKLDGGALSFHGDGGAREHG
ncbi:MAG TPA: hypothetical protein VND62_03100, partial [Acidimicrobiales bacterium]|nr:hypothetical protein [Acidimicrobiales bacterium]